MKVISIIRNILVRVGADIQPFSQGMTSAQTSLSHFSQGMTSATSSTRSSVSAMGSVLGKLGGIVAAAFAVNKMIEFGKESITLASNLNEVQNVVDVTFGAMSNQINAFSKTAITQFGISELSAKKYSSTLGAMFKSSGLGGQQITTMSEKMAGLTADMASFYNLDTDAAFEKIQSGLAGEVKPLRELGINMSVANIQAYALTQGITKSYEKMTQAEQVLLRYNYLLSVSKDAQGDFARTSSSWANQTRLLSQQWDIMKTTLGQGFINALTPLLTVINSVIAKLQVAATYFKSFTELVWGSAGAVSGVVMPATDATDGLDAIGTAADNTGASVKKAAAAIKGSLGSFDQLNTIGQNASAGADAVVGGVSDGVSLDGVQKVTTPKLDTSAFEGLKNILKPIKTYLAEVGDMFKNFWSNIQPALQPIIIFLEKVFKPVWDGLKQHIFIVFDTIKKVLGGALEAIQGIIEVFSGLLTGNWTMLWKGIQDTFEGAWTIIKATFTGFMDATQNYWKIFVGMISVEWETAWNAIQNFASGLWDSMKSIASKVWTSISTFFTSNWNSTKVNAIATWDGIKTSLSGVWNWLSSQASKVFIGIKTSITSSFSSIGNIVTSVWDGIKNSIKNSINSIIEVIDSFIRGINSVKITLPSVNIPLVGHVGGGTIGFPQIPEIPHLAEGTNDWRGGLTWVGERGPELVSLPKGAQVTPNNRLGLNAPPNSNSQSNDSLASTIASAVASAVVQALGSINGGNSGGDVVLKVGETEFGRVSIKSINAVHRQVGRTLLTV